MHKVPDAGTYAGTQARSTAHVLSIAKLRVGQEAYQLSGVAQSLDDYYTGAGEADGYWLGAGAERLGLEGLVDADDLRAVLAGMAPGSGGLTPDGRTIHPHPRRVPGFDLTFKVPKSVSVLYAVSDDPSVQGAIIDAGDTALRAAIGWLEREAIHVRRGTGNQRFLDTLAATDPDAADSARIRSEPGRGVVAAAFRHRTSRAGDPLLHWHALVANLAEGPDGRWTAFVHPDLYRSVRAAGEIFQAHLRQELTASLGIRWRPGRHVPEIAGVPQQLCDQFSKRSTEIDAWLDATGTPATPAGRQQAVLATRRAKPEVETERFDAAWKAEAIAAGWGPDHAADLIADTQPGPTWQTNPEIPTPVDAEAWIRELLEDLTRQDAAFDHNTLTRAIAERLGDGATVTTIERLVARALASPQSVPIHDDANGLWTSRDLLAVEQRFLRLLDSADHRRQPLDAQHVAIAVAASAGLGADQAAAVETLASSAGAIAVLVGPAGTGKTHTLHTLRSAYQAAGFQVIGAAPSARAALELEAGANIPAATIHRLAGQWERGFDRPTPCTVLVIDEAAMAGTRDLESITSTVINAGGRVVLAGDHHQLPEVEAGGGFAAAVAASSTTTATLTVNRRQRASWEQAALEQLRDGDVSTAVHAYLAHDRVIAVDAPAALHAEAVKKWLDALNGGRSAVLLAGTNHTVDALNRSARTELLDQGRLGDCLGTIAGKDYRVGERVVLRQNSYRHRDHQGVPLAVYNGQTATVLAVTADPVPGLRVRLDRTGHLVDLPADYVNEGGVQYGYALTSHRAQGGTWDVAIGVGLDGLYREAGYLQLSRGRDENWLIATRPDLDRLDTDLDRHDSTLVHPDDDENLDEQLADRLRRSRAKLLALSRDPHAGTIAHLAETVPLSQLEAWADHAVATTALADATVRRSPGRIAAEIQRAEDVATHIAPGVRVKAHDRNNIGSVLTVDEQRAAAQVEFVAADGRTAIKSLPWHELDLVDHPGDTRAITPEARAALDDLRSHNEQLLVEWTAVLASHDVQSDDAHVYRGAANVVINRTAAALAYERPDWLLDLIGDRPQPAFAATVWDDAVADLARAVAVVEGHWSTCPPLDGPTVAGLTESRIWLAGHTDQPSLPRPSRTSVELSDRLAELDDILDTAPPDCRQLVSEVLAGQLTFDDTTSVLAEALATQDDRARWILAHWPHIVEHSEVVNAVDPHLATENLGTPLR